MNKSNIPQTDSIQELAHFWDTHDLTDFEEQLEEVTEPIFDRAIHHLDEQEAFIQIRLQPKEIEAVKKVAKSRGIDYTDLIREWVLEKVHIV
ncbi:MAG TPA: CopG family antitoxin [Leptolyngbyaceae cyanobacterium]